MSQCIVAPWRGFVEARAFVAWVRRRSLCSVAELPFRVLIQVFPDILQARACAAWVRRRSLCSVALLPFRALVCRLELFLMRGHLDDGQTGVVHIDLALAWARRRTCFRIIVCGVVWSDAFRWNATRVLQATVDGIN
jgi:hypothetical protein